MAELRSNMITQGIDRASAPQFASCSRSKRRGFRQAVYCGV